METMINLTYPFYAAKSFLASGKHFNAGDVFPALELGLNKRKIVSLVETRKIRQDFSSDIVTKAPEVIQVPTIFDEVPTKTVDQLNTETKRRGRPKKEA